MESLKKIISLNQAAKISGYSQDYLGFLIRKGEMEGVKKGRTWFTTEEALKDYIFKKKVRSEKLAIREFFSPTRTKNIIIFVIIICAIIFVISNFSHKSSEQAEVNSTLGAEVENQSVFDSLSQ
jgi:hypothetical protein